MKGQGSAVSFGRYAREERNKNGPMPGMWEGDSTSGVPRRSRRKDIGRTACTAQPKIACFTRQARMSPTPIQPPASYEAALAELEQLVGRIESGQLPLEELLAGYQRGAQLLQFCRDKLQSVENQIKVL